MRPGFALLLNLCFPFLCLGQGLTTVLNSEDVAPTDPVVVINRKNPLNRVVAASPDILWVTQDGGLNWERTTTSGSPTAAGGHMLGSDRKGTLYDFYVNSNGQKAAGIAVRQSRDEGRSWEELGNLASPGTTELPRMGINSKGSEVIVTWTACIGDDPSAMESYLMLSRTKDGKKWSDPIRMNVEPGQCGGSEETPQGAGAVVSSDGFFLVAWSANEKLHLDRSLDKGGFWLTNDIEIGEQPGGWNLEVPEWKAAAGLPEIKIDNSAGRYNGSLFLVWADQRENKSSEVWLRRSINFGDNWTQGVRLHEESDDYRFSPAMAVDQTSGIVYVVYYQMNSEGSTDVRLAWSVDNGNSFTFTRVSENVFKADPAVDMGQKIGVDAHGGVITPVWTVVKDGRTALVTTSLQHKDLEKDQPKANSE